MILLSYLPIIVFALAIIVFALISLFLVYHWHRYAKGDAAVLLFETAHFVVGIALLAFAAGVVGKL